MAKSGLITGLIIFFCLIKLVSVTPVTNFHEEVKWHQEIIPLEGEEVGWLLAEGSDVRHLEIAADYYNITGGKVLPCLIVNYAAEDLKMAM